MMNHRAIWAELGISWIWGQDGNQYARCPLYNLIHEGTLVAEGISYEIATAMAIGLDPERGPLYLRNPDIDIQPIGGE